MSDVPRLVRDVLRRTVADEPDVELIDVETPASTSRDDAPDALIVGEAWAHQEHAMVRMLTHWPRTRIFMITTSGAAVVLYELQPQKRDLGELSPAELVNAIRASVVRWDAAVRQL